MAKIYAIPTEIKPYVFDFDNWKEEEDRYIQDIRNWLKKNQRSKHELIGEILNTPFADSHASYMVYSVKPFAMFALDIGDCWRDGFFEKNMNLKQAKEHVDRAERFADLFKK